MARQRWARVERLTVVADAARISVSDAKSVRYDGFAEVFDARDLASGSGVWTRCK